ncbi:hypothetical protein YALI2_C00267g [Yarrowia lipolytica]|nr:hypothetical protein YALI2_C00267g [Yarrowia lipolytica]
MTETEWKCDQCKTVFFASEHLVHRVVCNGIPYVLKPPNKDKDQEPEMILISQRRRRSSLFKIMNDP